MKCEKCGAINKETDTFCVNCGSFLQTNAASQTVDQIDAQYDSIINQVSSKNTNPSLEQTQVFNNVINQTNTNEGFNVTQQTIDNNFENTQDYTNVIGTNTVGAQIGNPTIVDNTVQNVQPTNTVPGIVEYPNTQTQQVIQPVNEVVQPVQQPVQEVAQPMQQSVATSNIPSAGIIEPNANQNANYNTSYNNDFNNAYQVPDSQVVDNGKEKNNKILIIAIAVVVVIILVLVGIFVIRPLFSNSTSSTPEPQVVSNLKTGTIGNEGYGYVTVENKYEESLNDNTLTYVNGEEVITLGYSDSSAAALATAKKAEYDEGYKLTLKILDEHNAYCLEGTISDKYVVSYFYDDNGKSYFLYLESPDESGPLFEVSETYKLSLED